MFNMKIFVDTDDDVRLARRIKRDTCERGRDVGGIIEQYTRFVKPSFDTYVQPSRKHADVIIPWFLLFFLSVFFIVVLLCPWCGLLFTVLHVFVFGFGLFVGWLLWDFERENAFLVRKRMASFCLLLSLVFCGSLPFILGFFFAFDVA